VISTEGPHLRFSENMKARLQTVSYTDGNLRQKKGAAHGRIYSI
jgi:hypothetical protein